MVVSTLSQSRYARWRYISHSSGRVQVSKMTPLVFLYVVLYLCWCGMLSCAQVLTKDSVTVTVDAVVYYRVDKPLSAVNNVNNFRWFCLFYLWSAQFYILFCVKLFVFWKYPIKFFTKKFINFYIKKSLEYIY